MTKQVAKEKAEIEEDKKKLLNSFKEVEKKEKELNRIKYQLKSQAK